MPRVKNFFSIFIWLLILVGKNARAQNLSFSSPQNFYPEATTKKAVDITLFKHTHFITWNDARNGCIHVTWLGKQYADPSDYSDVVIEGSESNFAPVLRATPNYLYVLWIDKEGGIRYAINTSDTGFTGSLIHTLGLVKPDRAALGLTAAFVGNKIAISTHATSKDELLYAVTDIAPNGELSSTELKKAPVRSADYPFVVALSGSAIRMTWRGYKDDGIYYADVDPGTGAWTTLTRLYKVKSSLSPAIYRVFNADKLFYIWKGARSDNKLYYTTEGEGGFPPVENELPAYFSTACAVSICNIDDKRFILAYTGHDNKVYLSWFTNYNPSRWMEETLYPAKAGYSLKDIALPGSHDAGMSILTATGGQQAGTINECNTLTQTQNVKSQLNAGIRMFDLRIGYYNKAFYTKHCSSDCMTDAIGGGYGERLGSILTAIKDFLTANTKESLILSFSHFCEAEAPASRVAQFITDSLGKKYLFASNGRKLNEIPLKEMAGKVIVVFERYADRSQSIDSCSIASASDCFINFRREYAATNVLSDLEAKEKLFFGMIGSDPLRRNDLVRLDWQLTQSADEAAMICNDFQDEHINPLINGAMLLTNTLRKHHSIKDLSLIGNRSILQKMNQWIADGTITRNNKPNILYVDVAGGWITDYCLQLNDNSLYTK